MKSSVGKQEGRPVAETAYTKSFQYSSVPDEKLALLHEASLEILQRTGMRFHHEEALDLFRRGGVQVCDGNLVRIPPHLVEWALRSVSRSFWLFDQTGRRAIWVGDHRSYFGAGSDCMHIYDLETGNRRTAVLQDVVNGVRLVDALANLDFVMSMVLPSDVPAERYERHQMAVMLQESSKPIVFVGIEASSTVYAVQMAEAVAGGPEQLQRYPFVVNYVNTVSPFQHNQESVERLLYAAERNLPSIYAPGRARGSLVPMTLAGALALGSAGHLAGLVLSQLKREGSPFLVRRPGGDAVDMRTMTNLYVAPDAGSAGWQLAHFQGLATFGEAGCSDAKVFDGQAAAEATLSIFDNMLNGVNLCHDVGYLDCAMTGSLELVALGDEIVGWFRRYFRSLEISEETLALDLIHQIGPDGHFLETRHTLRHVREEWAPALMDRLPFHRWETEGAATLQQRANRRVRDILASHRAEPKPASVLQELQAIIRQ